MSILFELDCKTQDNKYCHVSYAYDRGDYTVMKEELANVNWEIEFRRRNLNEQWSFLKDAIHSSVEKHIPKRRVHTKNSKRKPLWMTRTAIKAVKKKHRSWKKYLQTREHIYFQYFCRDRNAATRECRRARHEFENRLSDDNNPKVFYKYVNSRRKVNVGISNLKRNDGSLAETDTEKAKELNTFFKDVFVIENTDTIPDFHDRSGRY